jgi:glycosyltransferase involved in cell wall biosynthesis
MTTDKKKTTIGLMHFRIGETDGVSLEMEKWRIVLERLGYEVFYIAGSNGNHKNFIKIDGLNYRNETNIAINRVVYQHMDNDKTENEIKELIESYALEIKEDLIKAINEYGIDILVPNNVLSLGWNLSAGIATTEAVKETGIRLCAHHHDFHWERELYSNPAFEWVTDILKEYFPPIIEGAKHVVINTLAKKAMKNRKFESLVVPNVFDFESEVGMIDGFTEGMIEDIGIKENEIVFLQSTRIVRRKGIELIIDFIKCFNGEIKKHKGEVLYNGKAVDDNTEGVLVFTGDVEDEEYYFELIKHAARKDVDVIFASDQFADNRNIKGDKKIYSFWDGYLMADIVSYPSLLEGFGNQFLEALYWKKPVVIYEYPVYYDDLKKFGFDVISLGNCHEKKMCLVEVSTEAIESCVGQSIELLLSRDKYMKSCKKNYNIGLEHFSYKALEEKLNEICKGVE